MNLILLTFIIKCLIQHDSIIKNCKFEESIKHYGSANDIVEKILRSIGYIK